LKKATDKYQEARVKSEAAFAKFVATMQARYNLVEEDLKARFEVRICAYVIVFGFFSGLL
jgi:hypothetical protein